MAKLLINDGYTLDGSFDGKPFGLESCRFKYRAALPAAVYDYQQAMARTTSGADQMKVVSELLIPQGGQPRLQAWDIDGEKPDVPAPINADTLRHLPPVLLRHFTDSVSGYTQAKQLEDVKN